MTSLIIPLYQPGDVLQRTWQTLRRFIDYQPDAWEVVFVSDGCTDGSVECLVRWRESARADWCRILAYQPNRGKGWAVRVGLHAARGEVRVFTDVDLAYSFEDLRVVHAVRDGAPLAITSRVHPRSSVPFP